MRLLQDDDMEEIQVANMVGLQTVRELEDEFVKKFCMTILKLQEIVNDYDQNKKKKKKKKKKQQPIRSLSKKESKHVTWTSVIDDELTEADIKQMEADDQAIQTILLGLPEDIYAAVDSCETTQEIWLHVQQMMKGSQQPLPNNNYNPQPSFNQNYVQQTMINLITYPDTHIGYEHGTTAEGTGYGYNDNQIRCYNCRGLGHYARNCTVRPRRIDAAYLQTQLLITQKEEAKIQLQAEEYDLMYVAADIDEIEEVNANCILMANLQQASTSGIQTDKAPIYDSNDSAENDSDVITAAPSVEQSGGIVEQHFAIVEEIHAYYQSLYKNLAVEINALHLGSAKQTTTLNEEITNLNTQLSNEKSTISFLQEERKKLKSYFKKREDELLDKQILLENKIKGLENIRNRLGHNLFSVGQFCDSDLEVAFKRNTCFIRNLKGVYLLKGNQTSNLYTINLHDMAFASRIFLMARATSTKSRLWHQRLSYLNFDTINDLAKNDLVSGLPKFKYSKEHLCPSCEQGKSKRASHPPKPIPNSK
ncbi:retrovirus-related pol polyprotein from transposon TNT 1-94 [Tanacetum coccineum]|uniref:Retrovirus-related pol polyprotein from transposon TNT 1-94 n=1 Tax=Tanacetum coccineum TaxID=301880 RepID=A0ABQ5CYF8_9ASTR